MAAPSASLSREVVYVGGMPRATTEGELRAAFAHVGVQVGDIELVRNRVTGLPRGFAFVGVDGGASCEGDALALGRLRTATLDGTVLVVEVVPGIARR